MFVANVARHQVNWIFVFREENASDVLCPLLREGSLSVKAGDVSALTSASSFSVHTQHFTRKPVQLQLNDMETLNLGFEILHKKVCISLPKKSVLGGKHCPVCPSGLLCTISVHAIKK